MAKTPFLERLANPDQPLLADGAMGTLLHRHGLPMDTCFDSLNLTRPELVRDTHLSYINAGAELIETNTFGANRFKLTDHGLEEKLVEINQAGVRLAREAAQISGREDSVYIAGSIGPLGLGLQPYGRLKPEDARAAITEQVTALYGAGVDLLIFETFTDVAEMVVALEVAREAAPGLPVICQMTFAPDDRTLLGHLPGKVARDLRDAGADVIGVNCSGGPAQISRVLQAMRMAAPDAVFSAMPNAGFPETVGGRMMYPATVEYFADYALTFKALGACVVGGCCGTTPEHIAAMHDALSDRSRPLPRVTLLELGTEEERGAPDRPTELAYMFAKGHFVVSVEMNPPRSHNVERLLQSAELLRDSGADVLNIADSPTARMRMSPWAVCHLLQSRLGLETILHFPTRGRNLLRVQGDLLGAHALSLRNLFVVMGDPTRIGDYPEAMDNYDIVPSGLIRLIKQRMNVGVDQAGNSISQPTSFTVGCALNMGAQDIDKEIEVLVRKIDAGADFALVQPVFEPPIAEQFLRRYEQIAGGALRLPVLMGVMPLYSLRHALYLHNEVPGIVIPAPILKRMEAAGEDAAQEGVLVATELLAQMRAVVQGAYVIPSFNRYELAAQVVAAARQS